MKRLRGIVVSATAPSTDMLWIYKNKMMYFNAGKWETIETVKETETPTVLSKDSNDEVTLTGEDIKV